MSSGADIGGSGASRNPRWHGLSVAQKARTDIYLTSASLCQPRYIDPVSAWIEHAPFASWLVSILRPRSFVELGTYGGYSYFAVCQAVEAHGLDTRCYAVDHWKGDEHAGFYAEDVFGRVEAHNNKHYAAFSRLIHSTFDDAASHFPDGSIDLLHIDGRHFYEDVAHDFERWRPKLSERSVVLFHDTNVRERGFGVFRLWSELSGNHSNRFEFYHGHGLGVLGCGPQLPAGVVEFFEAARDPEVANGLRQAYARLGRTISLDLQARHASTEATAANATTAAVRTALAEAQTRIAALEESTARLGEAQARIAAFEATVASAEERITDLRAALQERTARFHEAQARITTAEASIAEAEARAAQLGRTLEERTAELVHTRERSAAIENSLAQRDRDLALLRQRIAAIKKSLSWRLIAPFRELYRPVRWLQGARVGIKLRAAWRHPAHSHKRKAYRANRMYESVTGVGSDPRRPTKSSARLQALIRHPFSSERRSAYRERLRGAPPHSDGAGSSYGSAAAGWASPASVVPELAAAHAGGTDASLFRQHIRNAVNGSALGDYIPLSAQPIAASACHVKLIAYYLPQFHPIPENDASWGKGFTEWRNVARAFPVFDGHYQPRIPGELGYYDLRLVDNMRRQVELAKHHGISAFCFHFYWFGGKRLLELPIESFLSNKDLDLQFSLCWANENWSRRWDGGDKEIVIAQNHSPDDDISFIRYLDKYFRDRRYMKVDGKPVLTVYRPAVLPNARETITRWRDEIGKMGYPGLYLIATTSFSFKDYAAYGFDALSEFPPHSTQPRRIDGNLELSSVSNGTRIYSYESVVDLELTKTPITGTVHPGVMPSWDNSARRPHNGSIYHGATPALFRRWLGHCVMRAQANPKGERFVFINAWNEWAEGAYLQADQRYGYAYLTVCADVLRAAAASRRIAIVSHDAFPNGAQHQVLYLARMFREGFGYEVEIVLLGNGVLAPEFGKIARIHDLFSKDPQGPEARRLAEQLHAAGVRAAIANTTVSGLFAVTLKQAGLRVISRVVELPGLIRSYRLETHASAIASHCDAVVFPAELVRDSFGEFAKLDDGRVIILPPGLYKRPAARDARQISLGRTDLRARLGISPDAQIVLGVGYADRRKGIDLFVEVAIAVCRRRKSAIFVWIGHFDRTIESAIRQQVTEAGLAGRVLFPGRIAHAEIDAFYTGADIFLLTSREDPFPQVVLEALDAGLPAVAFEGATGCTDLIAGGCGRLVSRFDTRALAAAVEDLLANPGEARDLGGRGANMVASDFSYRRYAFEFAALADPTLKRVSVIVPNYSHLPYLEERLRSVRNQTYPVFEVIVLDDASTDGSREWLTDHVEEILPGARLILNTDNSGNVWRQWQRGVEASRGDFVWIAESDDIADARFLSRVLEDFQDPEVVLSYCQSRQMDREGKILADHYLNYVADISKDKWTLSYVATGRDEIRSALAIKNTIPNASAALFRRAPLLESLKTLSATLPEYRVSGDRVIYVELLTRGKVAFCSESLNDHRRHQSSVVHSANRIRHLREILKVQRLVRERFDIEPGVIQRQRSYAQEIYEYFDLSSTRYPRVETHPEFDEFFSMGEPDRSANAQVMPSGQFARTRGLLR